MKYQCGNFSVEVMIWRQKNIDNIYNPLRKEPLGEQLTLKLRANSDTDVVKILGYTFIYKPRTKGYVYIGKTIN